MAANKKISELPLHTVPYRDDLFVIVDSTSVETKKITLENIMASPGNIGSLNPAIGTFTAVQLPGNIEITANPSTGTLTIFNTTNQLLLLGNTESIFGIPTGTSIKLDENNNQVLVRISDQDRLIVENSGITIHGNVITLNSGETGAGVTAEYAGLEIDRGFSTNYEIVFEESTDTFRVGLTDSLQRVALIEDSPNNSYIPFWDSTSNQLVTSLSPLYVSDLDVILPNTPDSTSSLHVVVNKEYVNKVVGSYGLLFYMYDTTSTEADYKVCSLEIPEDPETYIEVSELSNDDYIDGWISSNSVNRLLKGVYNWNITIEKISGSKTLRLYWKMFERKNDTTEIEIATSSLSNEITTKSTFVTSLQLDNDYVLSDGSKIIGKIYANVTGNGNAPIVRIYMEGNTSSRWELPWGSNYALDADTLDGYDSSYFATTDHNHDSRYVNISGDDMTGTLKISGVTKADGYLYAGSTDPTNNTRLNYDGYFYATKVYNVDYNDVADFQKVDDKIIYGKVYRLTENGAKICTERCQLGAIGICSDTYGFGIGKKTKQSAPFAVSGWTLAYVDRQYEPGTPLTNDKNGNLTKITDEEKQRYPERLVALYDKPELREFWGINNEVNVDGRHWVKV